MAIEQWDGNEFLMSQRMDNMLEQTGTVIESDNKTALIETERRSACGQCSVGDSCGTSVIAGLFKQRSNCVRVSNCLHLQPGDRAVIGIPESVLLRAALWAYMVPLFFMIGFAMMTHLAGFHDGIVFISSLVGLFNGLYLSRLIRLRKVSDEIVLLRRTTAHAATVKFEH